MFSAIPGYQSYSFQGGEFHSARLNPQFLPSTQGGGGPFWANYSVGVVEPRNSFSASQCMPTFGGEQAGWQCALQRAQFQQAQVHQMLGIIGKLQYEVSRLNHVNSEKVVPINIKDMSALAKRENLNERTLLDFLQKQLTIPEYTEFTNAYNKQMAKSKTGCFEFFRKRKDRIDCFWKTVESHPAAFHTLKNQLVVPKMVGNYGAGLSYLVPSEHPGSSSGHAVVGRHSYPQQTPVGHIQAGRKDRRQYGAFANQQHFSAVEAESLQKPTRRVSRRVQQTTRPLKKANINSFPAPQGFSAGIVEKTKASAPSGSGLPPMGVAALYSTVNKRGGNLQTINEASVSVEAERVDGNQPSQDSSDEYKTPPQSPVKHQ